MKMLFVASLVCSVTVSVANLAHVSILGATWAVTIVTAFIHLAVCGWFKKAWKNLGDALEGLSYIR